MLWDQIGLSNVASLTWHNLEYQEVLHFSDTRQTHRLLYEEFIFNCNISYSSRHHPQHERNRVKGT